MDNLESGRPPKLAYTIPETCYATGCKRSKIYDLIGAGQLQIIKIGRRTLVKADSLYRLIDGE